MTKTSVLLSCSIKSGTEKKEQNVSKLYHFGRLRSHCILAIFTFNAIKGPEVKLPLKSDSVINNSIPDDSTIIKDSVSETECLTTKPISPHKFMIKPIPPQKIVSANKDVNPVSMLFSTVPTLSKTNRLNTANDQFDLSNSKRIVSSRKTHAPLSTSQIAYSNYFRTKMIDNCKQALLSADYTIAFWKTLVSLIQVSDPNSTCRRDQNDAELDSNPIGLTTTHQIPYNSSSHDASSSKFRAMYNMFAAEAIKRGNNTIRTCSSEVSEQLDAILKNNVFASSKTNVYGQKRLDINLSLLEQNASVLQDYFLIVFADLNHDMLFNLLSVVQSSKFQSIADKKTVDGFIKAWQTRERRKFKKTTARDISRSAPLRESERRTKQTNSMAREYAARLAIVAYDQYNKKKTILNAIKFLKSPHIKTFSEKDMDRLHEIFPSLLELIPAYDRLLRATSTSDLSEKNIQQSITLFMKQVSQFQNVLLATRQIIGPSGDCFIKGVEQVMARAFKYSYTDISKALYSTAPSSLKTDLDKLNNNLAKKIQEFCSVLEYSCLTRYWTGIHRLLDQKSTVKDSINLLDSGKRSFRFRNDYDPRVFPESFSARAQLSPGPLPKFFKPNVGNQDTFSKNHLKQWETTTKPENVFPSTSSDTQLRSIKETLEFMKVKQNLLRPSSEKLTVETFPIQQQHCSEEKKTSTKEKNPTITKLNSTKFKQTTKRKTNTIPRKQLRATLYNKTFDNTHRYSFRNQPKLNTANELQRHQTETILPSRTLLDNNIMHTNFPAHAYSQNNPSGNMLNFTSAPCSSTSINEQYVGKEMQPNTQSSTAPKPFDFQSLHLTDAVPLVSNLSPAMEDELSLIEEWLATAS